MTSGTPKSLAADVRRVLAAGRPLFLEALHLPAGLRVLVLAPHPDDFDAIAVTLRHFHRRGDEVRLTVISSSWSGVEDSFCSPPTRDRKAALREQEQRDSCRLFGLPGDRLVFLRLMEDDNGHPVDDEAGFARVRDHLLEFRPDVILLPHGNDTNAGHRFAFRMLERCAKSTDLSFTALLNRDPKTVEMRADLYTFFGEEEACWKAALLRCHRSQQRRNLNTRGYGLDERILRVNRRSASELSDRGPYAEVFEIWHAAAPLPGV